MPRYFFNLHNRVCLPDEEGAELPDLESARANAVKTARELMGEDLRSGELSLDHWIEVTDEAGEHALSLRFNEAVTITP